MFTCFFRYGPLNIDNSHLSHIFMSALFRERLMHLPLISFLCSPKGEHIVLALSDHPSHFCPESISKSTEVKLMKLDTLIEGHEGNCRMQES